MADKEVVDYIRKTASMGFSHESIRHALTKAGHKEKDINTAFSHMLQTSSSLSSSSYPPYSSSQSLSSNFPYLHHPSSHHDHHLEKSKVFIALVLFASVFSVAMLYQLYGKTTGMIGESFSTIAANVIADTSKQKIASGDSQTQVLLPSSKNSCNSMLGDDRDWCYFKLAKSENNFAFCGAINQDYLKDFCNGLFTQKPDCTKITNPLLLKECEKNS